MALLAFSLPLAFAEEPTKQIPPPVCTDGVVCYASGSKCVSDGDFVENQGFSAHARYSLNTEVVCVAFNGNQTKFYKSSIQALSTYGYNKDETVSRGLAVKRCQAQLDEMKEGYGRCEKVSQ